VGLYIVKKVGERVRRGDVLCQIHWNSRERLQRAMPLIEEAFEVRGRPARPRPLIHAVLEGQS
jgi:thymidine phosphorylase